MEFPPPEMSMPPPNFQPHSNFHQPRPFHPGGYHHKPYKSKYGMQVQDDFDGKRLRKSVMRKTVDYNSSIVKALENRVWQRDQRDRRGLQPENCYVSDLMPPSSYIDNPSNAITTRFVKTATNKMRCPIFTLAWTPEGRRLITGASSGEFTLWNGLTFNFETILQAHTVSVRAMVWSHNDQWMITGDHNGFVKYWQSNMNQAVQFQAHKEPIRGISFCPTDSKFVTCSDDGTLRIFDFLRSQEEKVMRGHGADVKCVHWHPTKSLIVSGSKDNQQPIKLWDPKSGQALATLHAHKSTVMDLKWNDNGNWLITASRDHLLKLFDLRNLKEDLQTFRGHKKEASAVSWHPVHEGMFTSGGSDGQILFWNVGTDKEIGSIEAAHESIVWTLAWHPIGHILCSGSNDHTVKFWTRNRPGDQMRDKYNLNTLPPSLAGLEDYEMDEHIVIPGMGGMNEDRIDFGDQQISLNEPPPSIVNNQPNIIARDQIAIGGAPTIPGLDLDVSVVRDKKTSSSKIITQKIQSQSKDESKIDEMYGITAHDPESILTCVREVVTKMVTSIPGVIPLEDLKPEKLQVYGKEIDVHPGSKLHQSILEGFDSLHKYVHSGEIEELDDLIPHEDFSDYTAIEFIEDHAVETVGDEENEDKEQDESNDGDDNEPNSKRFRSDSYDNEASNDYEPRYRDDSPVIPSLLNLNVAPPRHGLQDKNPKANSPTNIPWESNNFNNNGSFGGNNNSSNSSLANKDQDRRQGRARQGSRWSSNNRR